MAASPQRRSRDGKGLASPRSQPLFGFDLGAVSCFCIHTGKKGQGSELIDERRRGQGAYSLPRAEAPSFCDVTRLAKGSQQPGFTEDAVGAASTVPAAVASGASRCRSDGAGGFVEDISNKVSDFVHHVQPSAHTACPMKTAKWANSVAASILNPFVSAVLSGRMIEAYRLLGAAEDPSSFIVESEMARVRRLGDCFTASFQEMAWLKDVSTGSGALVEVDDVTGLGFAACWETDAVVTVSIMEHHTSDPAKDMLKAFVAFCEVDLGISLLDSGDHEASSLGPQSQRCDESCWHLVRSRGHLDQILEVYSADALEEAEKSLWVCWRAVLGTSSALHGVPVPPVASGHTREGGERTSFHLSLTTDGFRLTLCRRHVLSKGQRWLQSFTPSLALRRRFRRDVGQYVDRLESLLKTPALDERLKSSARAPFYEQVRRRLLTAEKR